MEFPRDYYIEKGVDILLAKDMLTKAIKNHYDVAILVSADGDYASVVQEVKDAGKHVEVAIVDGVSAYALRQVADKIVLLTDEFLSDCWLE